MSSQHTVQPYVLWQAIWDGKNIVLIPTLLALCQHRHGASTKLMYTTSSQEIQPALPSSTHLRSGSMASYCSKGACDPCFVHSSQIHADTSCHVSLSSDQRTMPSSSSVTVACVPGLLLPEIGFGS